MITNETSSQEVLDGLTPKQVEVLDLLVQHNTTKDIARKLRLAPTTVDHRLKGLRDKWGLADRNELARYYLDILENCGKTTNQFSSVATDPSSGLFDLRDLPRSPEFSVSDVTTFDNWYLPTPAPTVLESLDERFGICGRVGAIAALAMVLALVAVLVLVVGNTLSELL